MGLVELFQSLPEQCLITSLCIYINLEMQVKQSTLKSPSSLLSTPLKRSFKVENGSTKHHIEFQVVGDDYAGEMSDEEKEAQLNRQREQYILQKDNRKKEMIRRKKLDFGDTSSEDDDEEDDEEMEKEEIKGIQKMSPETKSSKQSFSNRSDSFNQFTLLMYPPIPFNIGISSTHLTLHKSYELKSISKIAIFPKSPQGKNRIQILVGSEKLNIEGEDSYKVFTKIVKAVMGEKEQQQQSKAEKDSDGAFQGVIRKKSQVLGKWQTRFISINSKMLTSHKQSNSKPTMTIESQSISQLSTTFALHNELLIVRLIYSNGTKTDFGIGVKSNWLAAFLILIG